jgi:hypothetical protein
MSKRARLDRASLAGGTCSPPSPESAVIVSKRSWPGGPSRPMLICNDQPAVDADGTSNPVPGWIG